MPNIKEIALKVARNMADFPIEHEPYEYQINFAEALIDELAKGNEPVHWRALLSADQQKGEVVDTPRIAGFSSLKAAEQFCAEKKDFKGWIYTVEPLYTLPPTASQIEQETAEAIAKFVAFQRNDIPATGIEFAEAIRSGAWKEFK